MADQSSLIVRVALCCAALACAPGTHAAATKSKANATEMERLMKMSDQLDRMEKQDEFDAAITQANGCMKAWNFACAEAELAKAAQSAAGAPDRNTLAASHQTFAAEKQKAAAEARLRAEREQQAAAEARVVAERERQAAEAARLVAEQEEREERAERRREWRQQEREEREQEMARKRDLQDTLDMIRNAGNSVSASIAQSSSALAGSGRNVSGGSSSERSASSISSTCKARCGSQESSCNNGSQSGCYRAAACQCQCFLDNAPSNPSRGEWQRCVRENTANADALKSPSNMPTFSFGKTAPAAPLAPPRDTGKAAQECYGRGCFVGSAAK